MDRALESQAALPATLFNCAVTACCKLEDLEGAHGQGLGKGLPSGTNKGVRQIGEECWRATSNDLDNVRGEGKGLKRKPELCDLQVLSVAQCLRLLFRAGQCACSCCPSSSAPPITLC